MNSTGTITATNTYGLAGLISRHTSSGSTFYEFDPQGTVVQRLNSAGSNTITSTADAFGNVANSGTVSDPFGYEAQAGYYTDQSTGLILTSFRYYDPVNGRFLNRDPISYLGGMNVYGYCENQPENRLDPAGLAEITVTLGTIFQGFIPGWGTDVGVIIGTDGISLTGDGYAGAGLGLGYAAGPSAAWSLTDPAVPPGGSEWGFTKGIAGFLTVMDVGAGIAVSKPLTGPASLSFSGSGSYKGKGFPGVGLGAGVMATLGLQGTAGITWKQIGKFIRKVVKSLTGGSPGSSCAVNPARDDGVH
jgi:RHS repeat-associated protein